MRIFEIKIAESLEMLSISDIIFIKLLLISFILLEFTEGNFFKILFVLFWFSKNCKSFNSHILPLKLLLQKHSAIQDGLFIKHISKNNPVLISVNKQFPFEEQLFKQFFWGI